MKLDKDYSAFFALLRAGLWEESVRLSCYETLDINVLYQLAEAQSVVGLTAAGLERIEDRRVTKPEALPFLKKVYSLEGRNALMNSFIEDLVLKMRNIGIYTILVKGQGVAQCYERPQWRSSGDIDFWLDGESFEKAKQWLTSIADSVGIESAYSKHLEMTLGLWTVELHGTLRCELSSRVDRVLDAIQQETFLQGAIRVWKNNETDVYLPYPDNDAILIFVHILQHFYKGGIGLRQICDWSRLLWTYRESIDVSKISNRLNSMRLLNEWCAFGALAVEYLGLPADAMPLYNASGKWSRKAQRILSFVLEVGNFGHNRDMSYYRKFPYFIRKAISFGRRIGDLCRHALIFPLDSFRFFSNMVLNGFRSAIRGE